MMLFDQMNTVDPAEKKEERKGGDLFLKTVRQTKL